jgi:hypothetical protein
LSDMLSIYRVASTPPDSKGEVHNPVPAKLVITDDPRTTNIEAAGDGQILEGHDWAIEQP